MAEITKELRDFITKHAAAESQAQSAPTARGAHLPRKLIPGMQGKRLTGPELAALHPILEKIPDETMRRTITGHFSLLTKYNAAALMINENSEVLRRFPSIAIELAEQISRTDRRAAVPRTR